MSKLIKKYQQSEVKQEIKDVFYLLLLQGLNYITPLLVLPYLMIVLGAEKFGYIGLSLSVCQYLMLIIDFGFNLSATKRIALAKNDQNKLNKIFSATVFAKIVLLFISFLVLIAISLIPQFAIYRSTMFVLFFMVIANAFFYLFLFQGLGKIRLVSIINTIAKLSIFPLYFIFVKSPDDYLIAAFLQAFVFVIATLICLIIVHKQKLASFVSVTINDITCELKESFPIFLSLAATSIYTASFVIVLGYFATSAEVGQYSAVDRIMRAICALVLSPILQAFYPKISSLAKNNYTQAKKLTKKTLYLVIGIMLIVGFFMYFLSPIIVNFLGKDYQNTDILFKIMSFVPIFVGIAGIVGQLGMLAMGKNTDKKRYQNIYFIAGGISLVGIFTLIPIFNAQGAAFTLLITEIAVCSMMLYFGKIFIFK